MTIHDVTNLYQPLDPSVSRPPYERAPVITVREFAGTAAEWDGFVRGQHGWTHFHLYGWRSIIQRVHRHECIYLEARDAGGRLAGVLPLVRVKSRLFGHYLVSMPFLNYGGPLGDESAVIALVERATETARRDGVKLLELRSRVPLPITLPVSHRKVTVVLDLPAEGARALWDGFDTKLRTKVRRPQKEGVHIKFGADQAQAFFDVYAGRMRELGTPAQPRALFMAIAEAFPDECWFGCAYLGERVIACGCGFAWDDEFEMTWSAGRSEYKELRASMLLYWRFMERAASAGLRTFNFGRSTPGSGTHEFKLQWGARDEQLWWYDLSSEAGATTPSPDHGPYSWGPRVWKRLPITLTTTLGPAIVRYLP
jgi:serine/alanine adding enzyme